MTNNFPAPDTSNPFELFTNWMTEAHEKEINDPSATALATVDEHGFPNVRMVLLRGWDHGRFTFFTNYNSQKGREILSHPSVALCLHWKSLRRQIRIQGQASPTTDAQADAYFNARARGSRIGAWASLQSEPLDARQTLLARYKFYEDKFKDEDVIPRPPHWSGFHVTPQRIEFWSEIEFRLHERLVFTRDENGSWETAFLYP